MEKCTASTASGGEATRFPPYGLALHYLLALSMFVRRHGDVHSVSMTQKQIHHTR